MLLILNGEKAGVEMTVTAPAWAENEDEGKAREAGKDRKRAKTKDGKKARTPRKEETLARRLAGGTYRENINREKSQRSVLRGSAKARSEQCAHRKSSAEESSI